MSWLCLHCSHEVEPNPELKACPQCGDEGIPADLDKKVAVRITIHELRILVMWAEFNASGQKDLAARQRLQRVVYGIADRLILQLPEGSGPLTFMGELSEVRGAGYALETNFPEPPIKEGDPP